MPGYLEIIALKYGTVYTGTLSTEVAFAGCTSFRGKRGGKSHAKLRLGPRSTVGPLRRAAATPCGGRGLSARLELPGASSLPSLPPPFLPSVCDEPRARATRVNWLENLAIRYSTRLPPRDTCLRAIHIFVRQLRANERVSERSGRMSARVALLKHNCTTVCGV